MGVEVNSVVFFVPLLSPGFNPRAGRMKRCSQHTRSKATREIPVCLAKWTPPCYGGGDPLYSPTLFFVPGPSKGWRAATAATVVPKTPRKESSPQRGTGIRGPYYAKIWWRVLIFFLSLSRLLPLHSEG